MLQSLLLGSLVLLCVLLIISLVRKPFDDRVRNPCRFKILPPKYRIEEDKKYASFNIIVEKKHRYFINFPLVFKFYSEAKFKSIIKVYYSTPDEKRQILFDREIEFFAKTKEYILYITDVIMGKIYIEVELEVDHGNPIIGFEIMQNSTCTLMKEQKLELKFPE